MARTIVATDNFNRANGALGANWSNTFDTPPQIVSNAVQNVNAADNTAFWSANSFSNNQYSQITVTQWGTGSYSGVIIRANASDYVIGQYVNHLGGYGIFWLNGGAYTQIGSTYVASKSDGDVLVLEAEGTTFRLFINGIERVSGVNASAPASGSAGIIASDDTATAIIDDWEGGNITAPAASTPLRMLMGCGT